MLAMRREIYEYKSDPNPNGKKIADQIAFRLDENFLGNNRLLDVITDKVEFRMSVETYFEPRKSLSDFAQSSSLTPLGCCTRTAKLSYTLSLYQVSQKKAIFWNSNVLHPLMYRYGCIEDHLSLGRRYDLDPILIRSLLSHIER